MAEKFPTPSEPDDELLSLVLSELPDDERPFLLDGIVAEAMDRHPDQQFEEDLKNRLIDMTEMHRLTQEHERQQNEQG